MSDYQWIGRICLIMILGFSVGVFGAADVNLPIGTSDSGLSPLELKIWNDPGFRRHFAESYIAETEIEPRVTMDERDQMLEIMELISEDKLDKAAAMLIESRNEAASAVFDFTLANIYFQQEKLDEALTAYQIAVDKYPKFRRAWRNLGSIYVRQGTFEKALPTLTQVVSLGGGDSVTYGLLGYAYYMTENFLSAESAYRMAILLDPKTLDWKMQLAKTLFRQQRFAEALALSDQLIKDQPEQADLWLLQANAYLGLKQPIKAAEIYELVDHLGKSTVSSLNLLGDIYVNESLYEMAIKSYIRAMEKDPDGKIDRYVRAAKVLTARGALDKAKSLIEYMETNKADQLQKEEQKELLKLRARLAVASGSDDAEQIQILTEIVELDPLDGEALILLGQHHGRTGDVQKAIFYFERAQSIEEFEADACIRHAQLLVGEGQYKDALPLLRRAQQIKPRDNIHEYLEQVEKVSKTQ